MMASYDFYYSLVHSKKTTITSPAFVILDVFLNQEHLRQSSRQFVRPGAHGISTFNQRKGDHCGGFPKNPDPSRMAILRTRTLAIQVQTLPLEGRKILRVSMFSMFAPRTCCKGIPIFLGKKRQVIWKHLFSNKNAPKQNNCCVKLMQF